VVHARLIGAGLKDFKKCKEEIEMCLKPGGIMVGYINEDYIVLTVADQVLARR
jgi:hypothetical protein